MDEKTRKILKDIEDRLTSPDATDEDYRKALDELSDYDGVPESYTLLATAHIRGYGFWTDANEASEIIDLMIRTFHEGRDVADAYMMSAPISDLRQLADAGNTMAEMVIGRRLLHDGYPEGVTEEDVIRWVTDSANKGNGEACFLMAMMCHREILPAKDELKWLDASANKGYVGAMRVLSDIYRTGDGVEESMETSEKYLVMAADHGDVGAMYDLYRIYLTGDGYGRSVEKAISYLVKAAERTWDPALQTELANHYVSGMTVTQSFPEAFKWYTRAADQGDAEAQHNLAQMYFFGEGRDVSHAKAFEWFMRAAEQGYDRSEAEIGYMYSCGYGVEKDDAKAFEWTSKAAGKGNVNALAMLGHFYLEGTGTERDPEKAKELFVASAERGNVQAALTLGEMFAKGDVFAKSKKDAAYWLQKAADGGVRRAQMLLRELLSDDVSLDDLKRKADSGDSASQYELGLMYIEGRGVERSYETAERYLAMSSDGRYYPAMLSLAYLYGTGDKEHAPDHKKEFELYTRVIHSYNAVERNMDDAVLMYAQHMASVAYLEGRGVERSPERAFELAVKAADGKSPQYLCDLGELYVGGIGTRRSPEKALECFSAAESKGYHHATVRIGMLYDDGLIPGKGKEDAVAMFRKAADANDPEGLVRLAGAYSEGRGVERDDRKAFELYFLSANKGNGEAMFMTSVCYSNGVGTERDEKKGESWLDRASASGYPDAVYAVAIRKLSSAKTPEDCTGPMDMIRYAALNGVPQACFAMGKMALDSGSEENLPYAVHWLGKAVDKGIVDAMYELGRMYLQGKGVQRSEKKAKELFERALEGARTELREKIEEELKKL